MTKLRLLYPNGFKPASIAARRGSRNGGSAKRLAELLERLVGGEAGAVGGDLEQDAVRLAEIETAEIEAVDLAAVRDAQIRQPLRPGVVFFFVRRAEGDVMHGAGALARRRQIRILDGTWSSAAGPPSPIA